MIQKSSGGTAAPRRLRVLLIAPPWGDVYGRFRPAARVGVFYPPLGLCYLSSHLQAAGHRVRLVDAEAEGLDLDGIRREALRWGPDLVGIQVVSPLWDVVRELCAMLKSDSAAPIVLGGPHVTVVRGETFEQNPWFDVAVPGEGEDPLCELADALAAGRPLEGVLGVLVRSEASWTESASAPRRNDLDSYLFPDRSGLPGERYLFSVPGAGGGIQRFATITSTRGCPFECTFCSEPLIFGRRTRFRSARDVVDEMEAARRATAARHFIFVDDTLTVDPRRALALCEEIERRGLVVTFEGWTHANTVTPELLRRLARAGLRRLSFGIEAGDPGILRSLRKGTDHGRIVAAIRAAKAAGLETRGSVILGLPGETRATVEASIRFATQLKELDQCYFNIAMPYPGTPIRAQALAGEGGTRLLSREYSLLRRQGQEVVMEVNDLTAATLLRLQRKAYRSFWLQPRRIAYNLTRAGWRAGLLNAVAFARSFLLPARRRSVLPVSEVRRIDELAVRPPVGALE